MKTSLFPRFLTAAVLGFATLALVPPAHAGYVSGPNGGFIARGPGGRYVAQGPNGNYAFGRVAPVYCPPRYVAPVVVAPVVVAPRPIVVAPAPTVVIYTPARVTVVAVQARLKALGYYPGPVDGVVGPATRGAICRFQSENRLVVTGEINPTLIAVLRV